MGGDCRSAARLIALQTAAAQKDLIAGFLPKHRQQQAPVGLGKDVSNGGDSRARLNQLGAVGRLCVGGLINPGGNRGDALIKASIRLIAGSAPNPRRRGRDDHIRHARESPGAHQPAPASSRAAGRRDAVDRLHSFFQKFGTNPLAVGSVYSPTLFRSWWASTPTP